MRRDAAGADEVASRPMRDQGRHGAEREVLDRAPVAMGVVAGEELRLEHANATLCRLLGDPPLGSSLRGPLLRRCGREWAEAIDGVRETGTGIRSRMSLDDRPWSLGVERLGSGKVGIYATQDDQRRQLIHALRNPLFGIRVAIRVLAKRPLDDETRDVVEQIERAAERAQTCLKELASRA